MKVKFTIATYNKVNELLKQRSECCILTIDPNIPFQSDAPDGSDTFQWPVIERNRVGGFG